MEYASDEVAVRVVSRIADPEPYQTAGVEVAMWVSLAKIVDLKSLSLPISQALEPSTWERFESFLNIG